MAALFTAVVTAICLYIGFQRPPADQAQLILALSKQYIDEREYGQAEQMLTIINERDEQAYKADFYVRIFVFNKKITMLRNSIYMLPLKKRPFS